MELLRLITGDLPFHFYLGWAFFSLLGFGVHKYVLYRNRTAARSKFNMSFFLRDNKFDILVGGVLSFLFARFHIEIMDLFVSLEYTEKSRMFVAFVFGYFYTSLFQILRKTKLGSILKSNTSVYGGER